MKERIGRAWLRATGWKLVGEAPEAPRYVLIAAPHTSNWDLPFMLAASYIYDLPMHWMGKDALFEPPFGWFLKALGGIPIDRSKPGGVVAQFVDTFRELGAKGERFVLSVPAEGTRSRRDFWKSGFYHIARGADVPIVLSFLDWKTKQTGIGAVIHPTGDIKADMEKIRAFYVGMEGRRPAHFTPPILREEIEGAEADAGSTIAEAS